MRAPLCYLSSLSLLCKRFSVIASRFPEVISRKQLTPRCVLAASSSLVVVTAEPLGLLYEKTSVWKSASTVRSFSSALTFWRVCRAPEARPAISGAAPPCRYFFSSFASNCEDDERSTAQSRRSRKPHAKSASDSTDSYVFPVGRALRYVELGRRYHSRTEGQADLREWLAEGSFPFSANAMGPYLGSRDGHMKDSATLERDVYEPQLVAEVSAFTRYHVHHLLIEYKALRLRIVEAQAPCGRSQQTPNPAPFSDEKHRELRNTGGLSRSSCTSCSSSTTLSLRSLPAHLAAALTQSLFSISVLLHLSSLFAVAETHVERMLDVCFSASIFLAQAAAAAAAPRCEVRGGPSSSLISCKASPQKGTPAPMADALSKSKHLRSLHWAVVHFAAGVQHWGLLDHKSSLQNIERTQRPYERLLQTHAALLCEQTRRCVDHALFHELVLLKAGRRAAAARDAWFMGSEAAAYSLFFGTQPSSSPRTTAVDVRSLAHCVPPRLQQRRLQLLPLLWLSLLCSHLHKLQAAAGQAPLMCTAPCGLRSRVDEADVTWASARHAFVSLLPLFSRDARLDVTAWAILHLVFFPPGGYLPNILRAQDNSRQTRVSSVASATVTASLTELCAVLTRIEHDGAMEELAVLLPGPTGACLKSSAYLRLASFLRRWLDDRAAQSSSPPVLCSSNSGLGRGHGGCPQLGDAAPHTLQAPIHSAGQLYRALLNIPLSILYLPPTARAFCAGLPVHTAFTECFTTEFSQQVQQKPFVTIEGVCLLNQMLLRVLLQWRSDRRFHRLSQSSSDHVVRTLSRSEPRRSLGDASLDTSEDFSFLHEKHSQGADTGLGDKATDTGPGGVTSSAENRLLWEREVVCILKAIQHLGSLLQAGDVDAGFSDQSSFHSVALVRALVAPTAQAALRALAEQLGGSLLPWRLLLLHCERVTLTSTELQLLNTLDATLRHLLLPSPPNGPLARDTTESTTITRGVGSLPIIYRVSMNALLCTS